VLDLTATLLQVCAGESEGSLPCVIPHFLKGVPSFIMRAINMANDVLMNKLDVTQATLESLGITEDMVYSVAAILKYVGHRLEDYRRVNPWIRVDEAIRNIFERELDPKHLVYHNNPKAPVFIDTIYTSKGLEFDRVYIVNFVREGARVSRDKWGARLFYVGLTRSRGSVVILTTNKEGYIEWFPTKQIAELARKVGTEVIEK
jgi:superfamily I DNA/RNA helicase